MKKRIAVIGRGTAGAIAAAHFSRWTDWEIDWYYDPNIQTQAVGEGSTLVMPTNLFHYFNFSHEDLWKLDGTFKGGIAKEGWGKTGDYFFHNFNPPGIAYHFNAVKLQDYVRDKLKDKVNLIEQNVSNEDVDADYVMNCSGKPKDFSEYDAAEFIPVNSVYVTQCFWDYPRFQHTFAIAKNYGWVFGIPLLNRCSVGYMYNNSITTLDEVKEDVKEIFKRYNLTPSDTTNAFSFKNYYKKENFTERVAYNGNASFFLEPLEATSFGMVDKINRTAWDMWTTGRTIQHSQNVYVQKIRQIQNMIMLHYYAGAKYKTKFWEFAKDNGEKCMAQAAKDPYFKDICYTAMRANSLSKELIDNSSVDYGTWWTGSFFENINGLKIKENLLNVFYEADYA